MKGERSSQTSHSAFGFTQNCSAPILVARSILVGFMALALAGVLWLVRTACASSEVGVGVDVLMHSQKTTNRPPEVVRRRDCMGRNVRQG